MTAASVPPSVQPAENRALSLYQLLDPEVLANPYPLYHKLRSHDPVHWDPFLHAWVVTRYSDVVHVLHHFSASRTPTPEQLSALNLSALNPIAEVMVRQMLFLDPPDHTRLRALASAAFTPRRVEQLRSHIQEVMNTLLDGVVGKGGMDVIADFAGPAPAIVTCELLGVPANDHAKLKEWSQDFAEMLGNFQHNPDRFPRVLRSVENLCDYFRSAMQEQRVHKGEGLVQAMMAAEIDGARLTEEEIIANLIVTMVGGLETTTNLIGNGVLTLLRHPAALDQSARGLFSHSVRSGGVASVRESKPAYRQTRACGRGIGRKIHSQASGRHCGDGGWQPRSRALCRARCPGPLAKKQSASGFWVGGSFLFRGGAGADGRSNRVRYDSAAAAAIEPEFARSTGVAT